MADLQARITALEHPKDDHFKVVRIGPDGVARTSDGKTLAPGW